MIEPIFISVSLMAFLVAAVAYVVTPNERRFSKIDSIEGRLREAQAKGESKIIPAAANKKRCKIGNIFILTFIIAFSATFIIIGKNSDPCENVFGINIIIIALSMLFLIMGIVAFYSIRQMKNGINSMVTGYYPPLNYKACSDTISIKSKSSRIKGVIDIIIPITIFLIICMAHGILMDVSNNIGYQEIILLIGEKCKT